MKTLDEAAKEIYPYNEDEFSWTTTEKIEAFESGAEFAQRWIDISDEMPEVGIQILTKNGDNIGLSLPLTMWDIKDITEFATQWRPIELK